ncbi:hypothetical protein K439DRAFT_1342518, partial [Ramaria rubella]
VMYMYSKSGGKYTTHTWVKDSDNLGQLSYLNLQVYEQFFHAQFRAVPSHLREMYAVKFVHSPAQNWLCHLPQFPHLLRGLTEAIELVPESLE